ncbi:MAG: hypothetical protein A3C06_03170 [Candidatus Taylorbacteria bacterium RIFCSPHIGHO2_02_FULL_46_13]|uniref:Uncharacterized protein n=1 Tax=Candidatus Taylorbacteria bacterium RIFCSPHIGHO2_02_FULL_46_13 TaxID=1802312 RepID=A0A1G2MUD4_9BACT|nr:MAG: hypothetical protein A3C06_03170 [Candidatus Taylorbacteria bacterium RIFCSPHIGHO2_02_FULL_46_13]
MENNIVTKKSSTRKDISAYAYGFLTILVLVSFYFIPCLKLSFSNSLPQRCIELGVAENLLIFVPILIILWVFATVMMIIKLISKKRN